MMWLLRLALAPCSSVFRLCWIALLALFLTGFSGRSARANDLETIRAVLDAYAETVKSLSGRFTWTGTPSVHNKELYPNSLTMEDLTAEVGFEWDLSAGRRRYDERRSWVYSDFSNAPFEERTIRTFDGEHSYCLLFTFAKDPVDVGLPAEVPYQLNVSSRADIWVGLLPEHAAGLRVKWLNRPLGNLLHTTSARLEGRESIAGASCYRIVLHPAENKKLIIWLDPEHGWLPIRQEWIHLGKPRKAPYHNVDIIETTEFRQYENPGSGKIWFPAAARIRTWIDTTERIELIELRINPKLPVGRFRIPAADLPPGIRVYDIDGKFRYTGGSRGQKIWEERNRLYNEHEKIMNDRLGSPPAPQSSQNTAATPSGSVRAETVTAGWRPTLLIIIGSLLMLGLGVRMIWKSRGRTA